MKTTPTGIAPLDRLLVDADFARLLDAYDAADRERAEIEALGHHYRPAWHKAVGAASKAYRELLRRCDQLDPVTAAGLGLILDLRKKDRR
jgi:1,6-anhydro-N-acetylmuramate kinase